MKSPGRKTVDSAVRGSNRYRNGSLILRADDTRILRERLAELGLACHKEYMQTAVWQRVRREYEASALPKACVVCGSRRIQLHHRSYRRLGGKELLLDLLPFCNQHHTELHRLRKYPLSCPHRAVAEILKGMPRSDWPWKEATKDPILSTIVRIDGRKKITQDFIARALLRKWNLLGTNWVPRCRRDLILMERRIGPTACLVQYERIFGYSPLVYSISYHSMTGEEARACCRVLRGGSP